MGGVTEVTPSYLIYKIFSCILFFKALCINYFLDLVHAFKMGKYISIMRNTCLLVRLVSFGFFLLTEHIYEKKFIFYSVLTRTFSWS